MRALISILAVAIATAATPTIASESGMASMHSWKKVGRKTCLVGHQHAGSGSGPNRHVAAMRAVSDWSAFTSFEYGASWASFGNAIEKSMSCSGGIGSVQCSIDATPCRPW